MLICYDNLTYIQQSILAMMRVSYCHDQAERQAWALTPDPRAKAPRAPRVALAAKGRACLDGRLHWNHREAHRHALTNLEHQIDDAPRDDMIAVLRFVAASDWWRYDRGFYRYCGIWGRLWGMPLTDKGALLTTFVEFDDDKESA